MQGLGDKPKLNFVLTYVTFWWPSLLFKMRRILFSSRRVSNTLYFTLLVVGPDLVRLLLEWL